MDFESECSTRESVEDNDVNFGLEESNNDVRSNGLCPDDAVVVSLSSEGGDNVELGSLNLPSPPPTASTPSGVTPSTTKGYGLKKWRRIRRDVVKDGCPEVDSEKILKRGLPGSVGVNSGKPLEFRMSEVRHGSEGSVGSVNVFKTVGGSSVDSRQVIGLAFIAGGDSENSEDRSSRSSTAASVPKGKYASPVVMGYVRENNRGNSLSGKMVSSQGQRSQQGKGRVYSTKKQRGERVKIEKENSYSSIESDSRSSNILFMQGASSVNSNGKHSGGSMTYDGADSRNVHESEQKTGFEKETVREFEDLLHNDLAADISWEGKEEKIKNHQLSRDKDPLISSILSLQLVQEALEKEVQKFEEVGNGLGSILGHQSDDEALPANLTSTKIEAHELSHNGSSSLQTQVLSLTDDVKVLESKLEESRNMLEAKESLIAELEEILNVSRSAKEKCRSSMDLHQEKYKEYETELEGLFRQRVEAEVEYLVIIKTIQKMKTIVAVDNENLVEEQIALVEEQELIVDKLQEAEKKAGMLKKQAIELEKYCEDIMVTEEVMKVWGKIFKATSLFSLQLVLLLLFFWLFVLQLKPQSGAFIPT